MRDADQARRLLRAGSFPDPTTPRPETVMTTPTMPPDLYAAVQYLLDVAREKAAEADALLERHYAAAADPGYYRESEYPKGFDDTWNRVIGAMNATGDAAGVQGRVVRHRRVAGAAPAVRQPRAASRCHRGRGQADRAGGLPAHLRPVPRHSVR